MQEESIYNLLVPEKITIPKQQRYKSGHSPYVIPTGSTFVNKTTARPGIANLAGDKNQGPESHSYKGAHSGFGLPKGDYRPSTTDFVKCGSGRMGSNTLPQINNFAYKTYQRRDPIPKVVDKPVMGLKSDKNFIVSNIVDNVTNPPKKLGEAVNYTQKPNFGKVPKYLSDRKGRINDEYEYLRDMQKVDEENRQQSKYLMAPMEIEELRAALKQKWEHVNKEYQSITHKNKVDSEGLRRKKETCEKELAQIEKDLNKLSKNYIFVDYAY